MKILMIPIFSIAAISCARTKFLIHMPKKDDIVQKIDKVNLNSLWIQQGKFVSIQINTEGALILPIRDSPAFDRSEFFQKYFRTKNHFEKEFLSYIICKIPKPITKEAERDCLRIIIDRIEITHDYDHAADISSPVHVSREIVVYNTALSTVINSNINIIFTVQSADGAKIFEGIARGFARGSSFENGREHPDYRACLIAMENLGDFFTKTS